MDRRQESCGAKRPYGLFGVVEVLSKYLQSANPRLKDRATRVAELCQKVAAEMRIPAQEIDA
jgi:hypothetical protein